jgi:hypothetical protein
MKIDISVPLDFRHPFHPEFRLIGFGMARYASRLQILFSIRIAAEDHLALIASTITW